MMQFPERIEVPEATLTIVRTLEDAGYDTWCVGGALRDQLLRLPHADFDVATAAPPDRVRSLFRRTVPVGIEHGTIAVLDAGGSTHEVTTFRRDVATDGRHAEVEFGASLEEDLSRRDFTINAIAYHPIKKEWRDPFDGGEDLDRRIVRAVGRAEDRFAEDYLRILRAIRFATRFGFEIEPDTWAAALEHSGGLAKLSGERVRDEWLKSLNTASAPSRVATLWEAVGATRIWFGENSRLDRERVRLLDDFHPRDPVLMTCWLLSGSEPVLERLRFSRAEIQRGVAVDGFRDSYPDPGSLVDVRRWLASVAGAAEDLISIYELQRDDRALRDTVARIRANGDPLRLADLAVSGNDLIQAGVPEGPQLGRVLAGLLEEVLVDPGKNTKECLLETVRRENA